MQKNPQTVSIYWEASIFISDNGVLTWFCFLKNDVFTWALRIRFSIVMLLPLKFLSQEEVDCIDGIKSPYNHVKIEISASKSIFHSFHAVLWSMDHTQKMALQCI